MREAHVGLLERPLGGGERRATMQHEDDRCRLGVDLTNDVALALGAGDDLPDSSERIRRFRESTMRQCAAATLMSKRIDVARVVDGLALGVDERGGVCSEDRMHEAFEDAPKVEAT